jgi:hypothetical protein
MSTPISKLITEPAAAPSAEDERLIQEIIAQVESQPNPVSAYQPQHVSVAPPQYAPAPTQLVVADNSFLGRLKDMVNMPMLKTIGMLSVLFVIFTHPSVIQWITHFIPASLLSMPGGSFLPMLSLGILFSIATTFLK